MRLPAPTPALVVRYDYVWAREHAAGSDAGKTRPACIMAAVEHADQKIEVVLIPITHAEPKGETVGVEIPAAVRKVLGLDDSRCWAIVSEYNVDDWPSAGLSRVPGKRSAFKYGLMPLGIFRKLRSALASQIETRHAIRVSRR